MATPKNKYPLKRQQFIDRTALALGIDTSAAVSLVTIPRRQSIRINTLKTTRSQAVGELSPVANMLAPVSWYDDGFFLTTDTQHLRDTPFVTEGRGYIQNAASWLPVLALNPQPGDRVLDMCAAPGGKTSHIAQLTGNKAVITANDNSRTRLHKLRANMERLDARVAEYTFYDSTQLVRRMPDVTFDRILLDAPCSGEGMMNLDSEKDFASWSVAHIKRLQSLQKKLITQAWALLEPGGTLVYSTCTMAPEENEAVVDYLLRRFEDASIQDSTYRKSLSNSVASVREWNGRQYDDRIVHTLRLVPSESVEAFFVAVFVKTPSED